MQVWIASGDTKNKVLPIAYKSNILKENVNLLHIDSTELVN